MSPVPERNPEELGEMNIFALNRTIGNLAQSINTIAIEVRQNTTAISHLADEVGRVKAVQSPDHEVVEVVESLRPPIPWRLFAVLTLSSVTLTTLVGFFLHR